MEDLIKSLKAQLYERASSPLIFSFVVSWALWNYKFLLVLTAAGSLVEKFAFVEAHLFSNWMHYVGRGFLAPALSALAYIFIYPYPSRFVYAYTQKQQAQLKKIQQTIEDQTPITQEDARELRASLRKATSEHEKELGERDKTIKRLTEDLAAVEKTQPLASPQQDNSSGDRSLEIYHMLDKSQLALLAWIGGLPYGPSLQNYLNDPGPISRLTRMHNLDRLQELDLVHVTSNEDDTVLVTTPLGRAVAVKHNPSAGVVTLEQPQSITVETA